MRTIRKVRLSEIAELITKGTTPTTLGYDFQDNGVNFLKIECFSENGDFIKEKVAHISEKCHERLKRSQLRAGDVLFSIAGAIGRVAIVTKKMLPANTNQALAIIRIARDDIYLPYVKLILKSPIVKTQFERKKQGVAQLNISLKDITELEIPLPDMDQQIECAELFKKISEIIDFRQQELQKLDELVKSRFIELFSGTFEVVSAEDVCSDIVDCPHSTPKYDEKELIYPAIRTSEIQNGSILWDSMKYVGVVEYEKRVKRLKPERGDVVYAREGTYGDCVILPDEYEFCLGQRTMLFRPDYKICTSAYLHAALRSDAVKKQADESNAGSTVPHVNVADAKKFYFPLPPLELQQQFAAFVEQVDKSEFAVQQALDKAQLLFDSLMQKYFGYR